MNNKTRENIIRKAVKKAKAKGWRILPGAYKRPGRRCCALGALLVGKRVGFMDYEDEMAAAALSADPYWVAAFTVGFDNISAPESHISEESAFPPAYRLGQKLRKEFVEGA